MGGFSTERGRPRLFDLALEELGDLWVKQFEPFTQYRARSGAAGLFKTQATISVQELADLRPELRTAQTMVFRCGASGGGTRFALARSKRWPDDFFILDSGFSPAPPTFLSAAPTRELLGFSLIKPVERTLVNLALTSGAVAEALDLDDASYGPPGATGNSAYSFQFRPHSCDATVVTHESGQVEIDLVFVARRSREETVFVVEAKYEDRLGRKSATPSGTLAKSKLLFPVLAIQPRVPAGMPIVPVYLKAVVAEEVIDFHFAECNSYRGGQKGTETVDEMTVIRRRSLRLPLHFSRAN